MVDTPPERPCGETLHGSHRGHRYMIDGDVYQCPGGDVREQAADPNPAITEKLFANAEPAPPQTVAEQVRDLERIIQRVREAVGTDMVLVSCERHEASIAELTREAESLRSEVDGLRECIGWMRSALREAFDLSDDEAIDIVGSARHQRDEARQWARHGYEIGQRHCGWSDHGVAPAWLTEGWPPHIDSCEHLKQASEYDTTLSRVRTLASKRLDEDECSPPERDGYHDAMRMVLVLLNDNYEGRPVEADGDDA